MPPPGQAQIDNRVLLGVGAGTVGVMGNAGDLDAEVPLEVWGSGAQPSKARRRAGVVYREAGPWSGAVLALLRHLEKAGFAGAPRVVGSGFAADGREMV